MLNKKTILVIIGGALVLTLAIGAVALASFTRADAQEASLGNVSVAPLVGAAFGATDDGGFAHRGGGRFPGGGLPGRGLNDGTYLAEALGITVEELNIAQEAVRVKAIDQALAEGLITEAQAEALKEGSFGPGSRVPMLGGFLVSPDAIDYDALLAEELGISVEELQAARQEAVDLALQAKVDSGEMTEEQAQMLKARQALKDYIDMDALFSEVTGMTREEFQQAMQDAYKAAVEKAVADGVITQEQADQILSNDYGFGGHMFPGFGGKFGGRGGFRPFPGNPDNPTPDSDA